MADVVITQKETDTIKNAEKLKGFQHKAEPSFTSFKCHAVKMRPMDQNTNGKCFITNYLIIRSSSSTSNCNIRYKNKIGI